MRTVYGTIKHPNGQPAAGAVVDFQLSQGGYDGDRTQYTKVVAHTRASESGEIEIALWPNLEAVEQTHYRCTIYTGGQVESFLFVLPAGSEPISLSALRANMIEVDPEVHTGLVAFIEQEVSKIAAGPKGDDGLPGIVIGTEPPDTDSVLWFNPSEVIPPTFYWKMWKGTQAEFDALPERFNDTLYVITEN
jgi:hypothetical protein